MNDDGSAGESEITSSVDAEPNTTSRLPRKFNVRTRSGEKIYFAPSLFHITLDDMELHPVNTVKEIQEIVIAFSSSNGASNYPGKKLLKSCSEVTLLQGFSYRDMLDKKNMNYLVLDDFIREEVRRNTSGSLGGNDVVRETEVSTEIPEPKTLKIVVPGELVRKTVTVDLKQRCLFA